MHDEIMHQYQLNIPLLKELAKALKSMTNETIDGLEHIDRVCFRVKNPESFLEKVIDPTNDPGYKYPLVEVEDQIAGRIIVFFREDLDIIKEKILKSFNDVEFSRRRPPIDEAFGYESNHLILLIPPTLKTDAWIDRDDLPKTFELQIRTIFMHAYAEPQHNIGYKSIVDLPPNIRRELAWIAASSWGADQAYSRIIKWYEENKKN